MPRNMVRGAARHIPGHGPPEQEARPPNAMTLTREAGRTVGCSGRFGGKVAGACVDERAKAGEPCGRPWVADSPA